MIHKDGKIKEGVNYRIRSRWTERRSASRLLCNHRIPIKLNGKFYKTVTTPAILYGTKCGSIRSNMFIK